MCTFSGALALLEVNSCNDRRIFFESVCKISAWSFEMVKTVFDLDDPVVTGGVEVEHASSTSLFSVSTQTKVTDGCSS